MHDYDFETVFSYDNMFQAGHECCKGVRWKHSTQTFELELPIWVANLHRELMDGSYKPKHYQEFDIMERGKKRHIKALHISDRCVQKCLCKFFLKPLLTPKLIYDNSANIEGKGTDFAINRLKQHIAYHYKKHGRNGGILLLDYHDYFGSIRHDVLKDMLRKDIRDDRLYWLTCQCIDSFGGDVGLGLGSEVSQILAVYYRNTVDHYVKEQLHIKGYGCYMDDSYIIHEDIAYLNYCYQQVKRISDELGLQLNGKTKIVRLTDGFTYLKKRFRITETGKIIVKLSRDNITKRRQKLVKMCKNGIDATESYTCWKGYANHYDSYYTVRNMDNLYSHYMQERSE